MESLGRVNFEVEIQSRIEPIHVPNWFCVDAKTGVRFMTTAVFYVLSCFVTLDMPTLDRAMFLVFQTQCKILNPILLILGIESKGQ